MKKFNLLNSILGGEECLFRRIMTLHGENRNSSEVTRYIECLNNTEDGEDESNSCGNAELQLGGARNT